MDALGQSLEKYARRLDEQTAKMQVNHSKELPVRSEASSHKRLELVSAVIFVKPSQQQQFMELLGALRDAEEFFLFLLMTSNPLMLVLERTR